MLDIELKVGDRVKCIDEQGFIEYNAPYNMRILDQSSFIVESIHRHTIVFSGDIEGSANKITPGEYKFFEKEVVLNSELEHIISITHKAYIDGLLGSYKVEFHESPPSTTINAYTPNYTSSQAYVCHDDPVGSITKIYADFISSLYLETFDIKTLDDIAKIDLDRNPQIKFANGFKSNIVDCCSQGENPAITVEDDEFPRTYFDFTFNMIKGATITQEKGE